VRGVFIGSTILAVLVSLFAVAGMLVKTHVEPLTTASQSLSKGAFPLQDMFLLAGQTGAGDFLLAMIALGLVVAAISTADTFVVVATHSLSVDFLPHLQGDTSLSSNADDKSELTIFRARVMTACLGAAVLLLWYTLRSALDNPVGAFFVVYTVQFALLSPVVFGFWTATRSYLAALTGMLCGVSTAVVVGLWTLIGAGDRSAFAGFTANDVTSLLPAIVFVVGAVTHLLVLTFDKSSSKKK
jgi:hypothetical protein